MFTASTAVTKISFLACKNSAPQLNQHEIHWRDASGDTEKDGGGADGTEAENGAGRADAIFPKALKLFSQAGRFGTDDDGTPRHRIGADSNKRFVLFKKYLQSSEEF